MSILFKATLAVFVASLLGACAQQEEPAPTEVVVIEEDPVYTKY